MVEEAQASLSIRMGSLYRINGFDGKTEQGGTVDVYEINVNNWFSVEFRPDGIHGPEPRSVSALVANKD